MPRLKDKLSESKLIKAINALEESVAKGDALEDADPEGELSTEGDPLSGAAPRGRSETRKSRRASSSRSSSSSDSSSSGSGDRVSEMMSARPKGRGAPVVRKGPDMSGSSSSDDDSSNDDSSSDGGGYGGDRDSEGAEKSFRQRADGDETLRKGMLVNDWLEALVDQISLSMRDLSVSVKKSLARLERNLTSQVQDQVSKGFAGQTEFNVRLARGVAAIGSSIQEEVIDNIGEMVKSIGNQPLTAPRGKAVLSKGEVNQPPWSGPQLVTGPGPDGGGDFLAELGEISPDKIGDWLFKKSALNQVDPKVIMAWEADRYDNASLPLSVRKALVDDLNK